MKGDTMQRRYACLADDLEPGSSMTIEGDVAVALYRTSDGAFYATADSCTHELWSLGEDSDLEGTEVVCPLHMARFDITTGQAMCFPATIALATYTVEVDDDGKVFILE